MTGDVLNPCWTWSLLVAVGVLGGVGDVWVYKWARVDRAYWLAAACVAHVISVALFGLLLKWDGRAFCTMFVLSSVVHIVVVMAADVLFFGARPTAVEWAGIGAAAVAIALLELGRGDVPPDAAAPPRIESAAEPDPDGVQA